MGERETEVKKLNGLWGYLKGTPMALSRARAFNVIFGIYFLLHNPSLQSRGFVCLWRGVFIKHCKRLLSILFLSTQERQVPIKPLFGLE